MTVGISEFIDSFVHDVQALGIRPGGVLMVHPALRPFGYVPGGADTVIRGLLKALGEGGTLLMPSLTWENVTLNNPVFDLNKTPSCVGTIAEIFRLRSDTVRSMHPTHSVCATGSQSGSLLAHHGLDHTPCGPHSPYRKLPEVDGQILMLACGLVYNTSMHGIEELVVPPYLYGQPVLYTLIDRDNHRQEKAYIPHNFIGWQQRYDRVADILSEPALCSGLIAGTRSYLIEARSLWETVIPLLCQNPLYFIEKLDDNENI
ncbi:MAG: AAC(3) family N-acetyltransferase [Anaerolineales bacterium]|nr:AAC(3) family N-acetyltransferase [Anaerolineales bacterium]